MATHRVRSSVALILALPLAVLACGPFFYPAPPTLDRYPERFPVKTMQELLKESRASQEAPLTFEQLDELTRSIGRELATARPGELRKRIDAALVSNRSGTYRKRFSNFLYDLRDLLAGTDGLAPDAVAYAEWRADAMQWDDGFFIKPPAWDAWQNKEDELKKLKAAWLEKLNSTAEFIAAQAAHASPEVRPHWLVQAGAWQFKHLQFDEAARLFERVIADYPDHPRAEVAQLMLARTRIEQWRAFKDRSDNAGNNGKLDGLMLSAEEALRAYTRNYPQGRFATDIPGWRGGLLREAGNLGGAITQFLIQMDFTDHPEVVRGAVRECEKCLASLEGQRAEEDVLEGGEQPSLPLEEFAKRPIATLALVYHFLDADSRRDFQQELMSSEQPDSEVTDRLLVSGLRLRRAGRVILPRLAEAVAARKSLYAAGSWPSKYLAILAWAATEAGEHRQAVRVTEIQRPDEPEADDLIFVRAVAMQRAGDFASATQQFKRLQSQFPLSPLTSDSMFRLATCYRDQREAGLAVVELFRIRDELQRREAQGEETPPPPAQPPLRLVSEIAQWIDTLLQFAPLAELERGLAVPEIHQVHAERIRMILRQRYLAIEDFDNARRFAPSVPEPEAPEDSERLSGLLGARPGELGGTKWGATVDRLAALSSEIRATADPSTRAAKLFALAEEWGNVRGYLTLCSMEDFELFQSEFYEGWQLRVRNAQAAGFDLEEAGQELERRDELQRARRYYLAAADATPGTSLAAKALWRANETLRRMAELSPWSAARAFERNWAKESRTLHDRLVRECPDSDEARKLSVWWSFPPPAEAKWMPGDVSSRRLEVAIADAFAGLRTQPYESPQWRRYEQADTRLTELGSRADTLAAGDLAAELEAIYESFRPTLVNGVGAEIINHLDDLSSFLQEPGLTPSVRKKYFAMRLNDAPPSLDDPEMQPWADYVTFLALVRERGTVDPVTGEKTVRPMSDRMREFLEKFPKSRKRQAALARLAIASVRESHLHTGARTSEWPESPKLGGYKELSIRRGKPFNANEAFGILDRYDREYPQGRYAAEIRLWRGVACVDAEDWAPALTLLSDTLSDQSKRDLHLDASLNLADVFMRMLDQPEKRAAIVDAIGKVPSAQPFLTRFMHSETLGARLRCLEDYIAAKMPAKR
jgi:TolA-binding protein